MKKQKKKVVVMTEKGEEWGNDRKRGRSEVGQESSRVEQKSKK
jgi:hypothetical protein